MQNTSKESDKIQKQYFCVTCGSSFDKEDSFFEAYELHAGNLPVIGNPLCPRCCPENWVPRYYPTARIGKIRK